MSKPIYDDKENHTQEGNKLFWGLNRDLEFIFEKWMDDGYGVRDIAETMVSAALHVSSVLLLKKRIKRKPISQEDLPKVDSAGHHNDDCHCPDCPPAKPVMNGGLICGQTKS